MDGFSSTIVGNLDDAVELQIRLRRWRAADVVCFIRVADMDRVTVRVRVHGRGRDAELAASTHDADGYLSAIGDEDFLEKLAFHSFNRISLSFIRSPAAVGSGSRRRPP